MTNRFECNLELFPFRNKEKREWLVASAENKVKILEASDSKIMYVDQESVLCEMLKSSPHLLELTDPYSGYSAIHWAAKVIRTPSLLHSIVFIAA